MMTKEKTEQAEDLAKEIMDISRNTLLVRLRFLEPAFFKVQMIPDPEVEYATDGWSVRYGFLHVLRSYQISSGLVTHDCLHMMLHFIFHHPFVGEHVDPDLWNLASDIAVEEGIRELDLPETRCPKDGRMLPVLDDLKKRIGTLTAESIYHYFRDFGLSPEEIAAIREPFAADEHDLWYEHAKEDTDEQKDSDDSGQDDHSDSMSDKNPGENSQKEDKDSPGTSTQTGSEEDKSGDEPEEKKNPSVSKDDLLKEWEDISARIRTDLETTSSRWGEKAGTILRNLKECTRKKTDYRRFLRRFSVLGEAMKTNDEEFDYIFYTYGLHLYGNVPLIEPLEYKEVRRIRDFVLVIDTSASVDGELVQRFVQKTWEILSGEESFFTKINLHIIQADTKIQEDKKITSKEEMKEYLESMSLKGFGGTDFRPAFRYVNELVQKHEFSNLKGLIYFTDGEGTFPKEKPPYSTAFVFVSDGTDYGKYENIKIPVWAIRLVLDEDGIRKKETWEN